MNSIMGRFSSESVFTGEINISKTVDEPTSRQCQNQLNAMHK